MALLDKKDAVFDRDEKGELIPVEVSLDLLPGKPTALVKPIPRGKLLRLYNEAKKNAGLTGFDEDKEVILEHCIEPKFTREEVDAMKHVYIEALAHEIVSVSMGRKDIEKGEKNKAIEDAESMLEKKPLVPEDLSSGSSTNSVTNTST